LSKVKEHYEATPGKLMGWKNGYEQHIRNWVLADLFLVERWHGWPGPGTVNDWGCGNASFRSYLPKHWAYNGYDLSQKMLDAAKEDAVIYPQDELILSDVPTKIADYTVASGIFNVMQGTRDQWDFYVHHCFGKLNEMSRKGYAFNMLHARADRKQEGLFYASPQWCLPWLSGRGRTSILEYYSPWDFTILVQK